MERETNWGTAELVGAIRRATAAVARQHRGSVLGVGNLSKREGGQTGHSVSHKSGRDADLGMYARDARGRRVERTPFVPFDAQLRARGGRLTFDTERNLRLVLALLEDEHVGVQFILVAQWLKDALIAHAQQAGVPAAMLARMAVVLHQPSDSNPHQDHFHIRLYCSVQDRLYGCLERGPLHPWADLGDAAHAERVRDLMRVALMPQARLRRQGIEQLGRVRGYQAVALLVGALGHGDRRTRELALDALRAIGSPAAVPGILLLLQQTADAPAAVALLNALPAVGVPDPAGIARGVLAQPAATLHPTLAAALPGELVREALAQLAVYGREAAAPLALAHLEAHDPRTREAAHRALLRITNQPVRGRIGSRRARTRAPVVAAWRAFFADHAGEPWLAWVKRGLEARGVRLPPGPLTVAAAPALVEAIGALGRRDRVASDNAGLALAALTGHQVDPRWRSPRNNQRHWRSWLRDNPPAP